MLKLPRTKLGYLLAIASSMACADLAAQNATPLDFYGSLRTQVETVSPDRQDRLDSYSSLRDAYSRLGVNLDHELGAELALTGQLELAVDSANFRLRDPYDQGDAIHPGGQRFRVARIGLRSNAGSITYGQQWMPYYNAIAAPVDMFSSYYSGFATYTVFRVANTVAYSSPEYKGVSVAAAYAGSGGNRRSTSRIDDRRWQTTVTYAAGNTRLAAGIDDRGNAGYGRNRLYGLSASHQADKLSLAIKYELFDTGNRQVGAFSTDGNQAVNLFASYVLGKNTIKMMLAKVENYGDYIVHLGIDRPLSDDFKVFVEYYREAETAAISPRRGGLSDFDARVSGGHAAVVGIRYDF
ncbi:porin [Massilia soli]|uniref:Porin n=1 Tax=Massilia soli TaxID=2792854 RepID=A0ABS7SKH1_9BURK|nr:porin [Massilia soli]MBZ2205665.1 porin [Massilia soli]